MRKLFIISIFFIITALVIGSILEIKSIGKIDQVDRAAEEFDDRSLRFTPRFRTQVYRLQFVALRAQLTGDEIYTKRFHLLKIELLDFLTSRRDTFDQKEEEILFTHLEKELLLYLDELKPEEYTAIDRSNFESIDEIQERINNLGEILIPLGDDMRAMELRWQIQRCDASLLLVKAKASSRQVTIFQENIAELRRVLAEDNKVFAGDERKLNTLKRFDSKLALFEQFALQATNRWLKEKSPDHLLNELENLQSMRDEVIEIAESLGNSRHDSFMNSLKNYKSSADRLKYYIFIALGAIIISLILLGWLARVTFFNPMELHLAEAEKNASSRENLATLGTFASGVAHEIRNPLTTIKARLFALSELAGNDETIQRQTQAIQNESNRMEHIVQDFLKFARPPEAHLEEISIPSFLNEIQDTALPGLEEHSVALKHGPICDGHARLDPEQMKQVFLNLIRNAMEACEPNEGEITLSARRGDNNVILTIADNGSGISQDRKSRVFDPFYSKKKGGTGLGLPICRNIIENHQGALAFQSAPGEGTIFTITLPST